MCIYIIFLGIWKLKYFKHITRQYCFTCLPVFILERLHHRPVFTEAPQNLTLVLGSTGALACKVLSDLHPYIGWYNGEVTVENADNLNLTTLVKVKVRLGKKMELLEFNTLYAYIPNQKL